MNISHNMVGWFEIPVTDMERAIAFYEAVLEIKLEHMKFPTVDMAMFPAVENSIGAAGALSFNEQHYKPSTDGILIYFTAFSGDLSLELGRVEKAGGKILMPKMQISPEVGYMGLILDTEGNRIAFHSRS
jgi:predicted enzyme related to lactoylglutathione lyase